MSVNKQASLSRSPNSILAPYLSREAYDSSPFNGSKSSSQKDLRSKPYEYQINKHSPSPSPELRQRSYLNYDSNSSIDTSKKKQTINQNKSKQILYQRSSAGENDMDRSSVIQRSGYESIDKSNFFGVNGSAYASNEGQNSTKDESRSYFKIWKEVKESKDVSANVNRVQPVKRQQGKSKDNSYLRQHLNKKARNSESSQSSVSTNFWSLQAGCGQLDRRTGENMQPQKVEKKKFKQVSPRIVEILLDTKFQGHQDAKIDHDYRLDKINLREEMQNRGYGGSLNQVKKNLYERFQDLILDAKDYESRPENQDYEEKLFSINHKKKVYSCSNSLGESLANTPMRKRQSLSYLPQFDSVNENSYDRWSSSDRSINRKSYEEAAVKIQKAIRRYLEHKTYNPEPIKVAEFINRAKSAQRDRHSVAENGVEQQDFRRKGSEKSLSFGVKQLSQNLKLANKNILCLQLENEKLKENAREAEAEIEKQVEERVAIEKSRFEEMLRGYSRLIISLKKEKMEVERDYELIVNENQVLKAQLSGNGVNADSDRGFEEKVMGLESEREAMKGYYNKLLSGIKMLQEETKNGHSLEEIKTLEEENNSLKAKVGDLESRLHQNIEKMIRYAEIVEINQSLSLKLQYAEVERKNLEKRLRAAEIKYKALEKEQKNKLENISQTQGYNWVSLDDEKFVTRDDLKTITQERIDLSEKLTQASSLDNSKIQSAGNGDVEIVSELTDILKEKESENVTQSQQKQYVIRFL